MGLGILSTIKGFAPLMIYSIAIFFIFVALTEKRLNALWFLLALLPLRNVIDKLHVFPLGKDIDELFLFALLLGVILGSLSGKEKMFSRSPINAIAVLLIFYTFISLAQGSLYLNEYKIFDISSQRVQTWKNFCILPLLFFTTFNIIKTKKDIWRTVAVICCVMMFMNMYLLRQLSWYSSIESRVKINGTFMYLGPNEIAAFYNQYTLILISLFFAMKKSPAKVMMMYLIGANLFCVLFLFSRAAYAALFVGLFFLFSVKKRLLLIPLVLMAIYWQVALPEKVQERIRMTTNEYGELDRSSELRLAVWGQSLDLFQESPIIGIGFGVFNQLGYVLGDTHNIYVKILLEQGLVGITIFLILLFIFFIEGIKLFLGGDDDLAKGFGLGFAISIMVLMVNNFFGDRWTYPEVSAYLWVFAGLIARLNILSSQDQDSDEKSVSKKKRGMVQELNAKYGIQ